MGKSFGQPVVKFDGPPITPELQKVFGMFGQVKGILVYANTIHVEYESGEKVRFNPEVLN